MRTFWLAIALTLFSVNAAFADHHHSQWMTYLAGSWEWVGENDNGADVEWKLAAGGTALIGTSKNSQGQETAWIHGWDSTADRLRVTWYGETGSHGQVDYKIVDDTTLSGPVVVHSENSTTKAVVTLKKTGDDRFTVRWANVVVDGEKGDDWNLVVERK